MQRITFYEREQIELYLRMGKSCRWIGRRLNRNHTVISREIESHSGDYSPYAATLAETISKRKRRNTNKRKLEKENNKHLKEYVLSRLREDWSPEEIAGRLKNKSTSKFPDTVSHESIYQYIYNGTGRYEYLWPHLRMQRVERQIRWSRKKRAKITIKDRVSISQRPIVVSRRKRYGDWETDTVIGKGKSALSVQYERKGMIVRLHKVPDKSAKETEMAISDSIESLPKFFWKTITRDNGTENADHADTLKDYRIPSYFCDPFSSWQKGGVENLNKLIRQYLPKKTNLDKITEDEIYIIQEKLNNRPRKSLNVNVQIPVGVKVINIYSQL